MTKLPPEIERLYELGFKIHWLEPRLKKPLGGMGWNKKPPQTLEELKKTYVRGCNYGVRLGKVSHVAGAYLAVIDLDIKSSDEKHRKEAFTALFKLYPEIKKGPHLLSGRGNGSSHYYVRLVNPDREGRLERKARSPEMVKVHMPSVKTPHSADELEALSEDERKAGYRLRHAWEISLLSNGRQAVIVGSIHPDTGKQYTWGKPINATGDNIPFVTHDVPDFTFEELIEPSIESRPVKKSTKTRTPQTSGAPIDLRGRPRHEKIELVWVELDDLPLSAAQKAAITDGKGVGNRSDKIFELCLILTAAGVSDETIISLFVDRDYYLGRIAFEHEKTKDIQRAAKWVKNYCLKKAKLRVHQEVFDFDEASPLPSDEKLKQATQRKILEQAVKRGALKANKPRNTPKGLTGAPWEKQLKLKYFPKNKKTGKRYPPEIMNTYANIEVLFKNTFGTEFMKFDSFARKAYWTKDMPWGTEEHSRAGKERSAGSEDASLAKKWLFETYGMQPSPALIDESINTLAWQNLYHPVKQYLESLTWDGIPRIHEVFKKYMGAKMPEPYLSDVSRKFMLACIARIYDPGCKFDFMVILDGDQGIGKSTFPKILAGKKWFMEGLPANLHDKDAALNIIGKWICEFGELASLQRSELATAKAFISRYEDRIRPPFAPRVCDFPRRTVFLGTTDKKSYLNDPAGNRRYWPVHVTQCDFEALIRDKDQLWAEAKFTRDNFPEELFLTDENSKRIAKEAQESRMLEDDSNSMEEIFNSWAIDKSDEEINNLSLSKLLTAGPWNIFNSSRKYELGATALKRLGYTRKHTSKGNIWVLKK